MVKGLSYTKTPDDPNYSGIFHNIDHNITNTSYSTFSLAGVAGAEWVFKYRFGIDVRYQLGLGNFKGNNPEGILAQFSDKVTASAFEAGLFFRFGKKPAKK